MGRHFPLLPTAFHSERVELRSPKSAVYVGSQNVIDFEIYTDKIAQSGREVIRKAYEEARHRDHNQLISEHVLLSIAEVERTLFNEVMQSLNLDPEVVIQELTAKLDKFDYPGRGMKISEPLRTLFMNSLIHSREQRRRLINRPTSFMRCSSTNPTIR